VFSKITPEAAGVSSNAILELIRLLDDCRFRNHGIIISKCDSIVYESYYKPFHKDFLHRMYSVSKSFVSIAVGLAVTEGLISLDDVIVDYFPEFKNEETYDEYYAECTIRDMLKMSSNIGNFEPWWGRYKSRVGAYYTLKTDKVPDTLWWYDSMGSFLLGCIIEKLTGMTFLDYLKKNLLLELGFSRESYTLTEPGGFTVGDSGVMCTTRDLLILARLFMKKGEWNGKQLIYRSFMEEAISLQVTNDLDGKTSYFEDRGYGYLVWITHENGFSLLGAGDQLAICDMKNDVAFIMTADNQADAHAKRILFHELERHFFPKFSAEPIPENAEAHKRLTEYADRATLICQHGDTESPIAKDISGVTYVMEENTLGITYFRLDLENYVLEFDKSGKRLTLRFGIGENKLCNFSLGDRAVADKMGFREEGEYDCAVSGAWVEKRRFSVMAQVIDTYFGGLYITLGFKDDRATFVMKNSGQYVFCGATGYAIGKKQQKAD